MSSGVYNCDIQLENDFELFLYPLYEIYVYLYGLCPAETN